MERLIDKLLKREGGIIRTTDALAAGGSLPFIGSLSLMSGIVGMILLTTFLHRATVADIRWIIKLVTGAVFIVSTIRTAIVLPTKFTAIKTAVLCFLRADIFPKTTVEMNAVISRVTASGDKGPVLPYLSGYSRWGSPYHCSNDLK